MEKQLWKSIYQLPGSRKRCFSIWLVLILSKPQHEQLLTFELLMRKIVLRHNQQEEYNHQHLNEIGESLAGLQGNQNADVHFVPWRGDFTRGIFISSQLQCDLSLEEIEQLYNEYYANLSFTHLIKTSLFLKQVVNTNKCLIQLEQEGDQLVIHSAADNLLKGASGQAVQNMNLMFGLDETAGLLLKPVNF